MASLREARLSSALLTSTLLPPWSPTHLPALTSPRFHNLYFSCLSSFDAYASYLPRRPISDPFGGPYHPSRCRKRRHRSCRLSNREAFFSAVCMKPFSKPASVVYQQVCNIIHVMLQLILRFKCLFMWYHDGKLLRFIVLFFKDPPSNTQNIENYIFSSKLDTSHH